MEQNDEENRTSLKDEIKKTNEMLSKVLEGGKAKKIKGKKLSRREAKNKYIRYIYIDENKNIKAMKVPVDEGTTAIDGVPRVATADYMMMWDNQPTIIQPAWAVFPFDPVTNREEAVKRQMENAGFKLLLNKIELGQIKPKKKLSGAMIFGIVIAIIVIGYLLLRGFG